MSISTRIEAIEQHLTDDYSVLEVAGADLTNVDKNIINLKPTWQERLLYFINNGTQEVWDNWEKVVGEGTTITLNNTEEAPMTIVLKGNTSQNGTPTPTTPIPVNVVSGDNSINVVGKNLWNIGDISNIGWGSGNNDLKSLLNSLSSGTYTLSLNFKVISIVQSSSNNMYGVIFQNSGGNLQNRITTGTISVGDIIHFTYTFTIDNNKVSNFTNCYLYGFGSDGSGVTARSDVINNQLEKGSTATEYEEYKGASYPITLPEGMFLGWIPNTTYQDKIDKSNGKNLVETIDIYNGFPTGDIGGTIGYSSSSNSITYKKCAYVKANTTYTLSWDYATPKAQGDREIKIVNDNNIILESIYYSNSNYKKRTFTPTHNGWVYASLDANAINVMLNEGTTALEYEPYGTGWYVKKEIGKVVLDENTFLDYNGTAGMFYFANQGMLQNYKSNTSMLSDYLLYSSTTWVKNCFGINANNVFWLYIENGPTSTADLRTWLSTHNITVNYVLSTPTYTLIEDTTLINQLETIKKSYIGQTNITQENNDMPFILDITALKEM